MRKLIILFLFILISCNKHVKEYSKSDVKFKLEKIIIVNQFEGNVAFFRVNISNYSSYNLIYLDNSSSEYEYDVKGFYLENKKDTIKLILRNDSYFGVAKRSTKNYYFYTSNLDFTLPKDSIKFKKYISGYELKYNGKLINGVNVKNIQEYKKINDTFSINIDKGIKHIYCNEIPVYKNEWDKL